MIGLTFPCLTSLRFLQERVPDILQRQAGVSRNSVTGILQFSRAVTQCERCLCSTWKNMGFCSMQSYFMKFSRANGVSVSGRHRPPRVLPAIACIGLLSALLAACGGSSGSDVLSDSQIADTTQTRPAPSPPQTGGNTSYNLGNTSQNVIDQCMSEADKQMLTQVNTARSQPRGCGSENYPATAALGWHCTLEDVADAHSRDMGDYNFFSHTGSDGLTVGDRVGNAGYDWSAVGENIAAGQQTIDTVMAAWLDSPGHCANIMHSVYTEFGAASYIVDGSDYPIYWTQVFARPQL